MYSRRRILLSCFYIVSFLCLMLLSTHHLAKIKPSSTKLNGSLRPSTVITTNDDDNGGHHHHHHHHHHDYYDGYDYEDCVPPSDDGVLSVDQFGAQGTDNGCDDTEAFVKAWGQACSSEKEITLLVPAEKTYRLKPIIFTGPCHSALKIEIAGTLEASEDVADYEEDSRRRWLAFDSVHNLVVQGGGTLDGKGNMWWVNSCKINKTRNCTRAPTALSFIDNKNLVVKNLTIKDAQQMHLTFEKCENVKASNLLVKAPDHSPNTDGIHVTATRNIIIANSTVGTGDDCVSIVSGSKKVLVQDIICGPGHGISIGSLGKGNSKAHVSGVVVDGAKISRTTNGLRIKTWQGGSGYAKNILYQNVEMNDVKNPIIIDQNYCDQNEPCNIQESAVRVKNVVYHNISGTSATELGIDFDCSESHPCKGIQLQDVMIRTAGGRNAIAKATCKNVHLKILGNVSPGC